MTAAIVPYNLVRHEGGMTWVAECRFCEFKSEPRHIAINACAETEWHAKHPEEGDHYDPVSGLFYPPEELEAVREGRRQRRTILGSQEDTINLNQAGL